MEDRDFWLVEKGASYVGADTVALERTSIRGTTTYARPACGCVLT